MHPKLTRFSCAFFCIALLLMCQPSFSQTNNVTLQYQLQLFDSSIHVELLFNPIDSDSSKFTYGMPAFGGQKDILKGLQNLQAQSPAKISIDTTKRVVEFYYHQTDPVVVNYDVADTRKENSTRSQLFRPIIMPDYFFIHGVNLLLTPDFRKTDSTIRVSLQWKKLPPFKMFYTFDPDNDGSKPTITTADSISFRFLTGAKDLSVKKFSSESGDNYLVLRTNGITTATAKEVEDFYLGYNTTMRQFWNDKRKIKYSLVLQPYMNVNHSMSGVSFGNGFIGKYNRPDSLAKGERKFVVSHEIGHYYMGDLEAQAGENSEGQWFNEGFNDYITFFNLVRGNSMEPQEFEAGLNRIFKSLYNSSIKNTPNKKIFENFWLLGDYAKLPYWRGCIFAFYVDNKISLATKNKSTLRNLMLDLKELVKERSKKMFTDDEFIHEVSKYLPKEDFKKAFDEYIINGNTIAFSNNILIPFFTIEIKEQAPVLKIVNKKQFIDHYQFN